MERTTDADADGFASMYPGPFQSLLDDRGFNTPANWGRLDAGDLPESCHANVLAEYERVPTGDRVSIAYIPERAAWTVEWEAKDDRGHALAHAHGAETFDQAVGVLEAVIYMVNHLRNAE